MAKLVLSLFLSWNTHSVSVCDLERLTELTVLHAELNRIPAPVLASVLFQEGRLVEKPPRNGFGCGVGQILPVKSWGRPTCSELETYETGVAWAANILGRCRKKFGSVQSALACYHGRGKHHNSRYVKAVMSRIKHLQVIP